MQRHCFGLSWELLTVSALLLLHSTMGKWTRVFNDFGTDYNTDANELNRGEVPMGRESIYYTYASDLGLLEIGCTALIAILDRREVT